jgi:DNA-binding transcriptional MerR regulator
MSKKVPFFLSPQHAAGRLKLSVSRLRQLEAMGQLKAIRDSAGRRLYDSTEIDEFIRKREAQRREREQHLHTNSEPRPAA